MLTKSEANLIHALKTRAGREKHEAFVVEGVRVVEDLMAAGIDLKFAVVAPSLEDSPRGRAIGAALYARTTVRRLRDAELTALGATETSQGVIVIAHTPHRGLDQLQLSQRALVLVLDAVQDPGNLGTLIRSAEAFAATCVLALPGTVDYWNPKVVRAAAGAAFRVPLIGDSPERVWSWLAENAFIVCGADARGSSLQDLESARHIALVVGNEGSGLREETRAHVARMIAIPMPGRADSLNVAVAAGILLYELSRT
jgi:RNA methyltransferase, TrmH family